MAGTRISSVASQRGCVGSVLRFWQRTYAPDYLGFAMLLTAYMLIQFFMEPFHRMFHLDDINIQYPFAEQERVPVSWMFGYAGGVPLAVLIIWLLVSRSSVHKAHVTILGLFISLILTSFVTDVIKNAVGRPRPDLLFRCKPAEGTPEHALVNFEVCTETRHHVLHDGWRSFPSGHSSFAFAGLGYLALWMSGQLHVFRPRADLFKGLFALCPLLGAAMIAISRCEDYRHDVYDVTVGSAIGVSIALFSYRRYFPNLRSTRCNEPFASRAEGEDGFGKIKDDEEALRDAEEFELESADEA